MNQKPSPKDHDAGSSPSRPSATHPGDSRESASLPSQEDLYSTDDLLAACLRAPSSEQRRLLDEVCAQHPDLEKELREQFQTLFDLGLAGLATMSQDGDGTDASQGNGAAPKARILDDFELLQPIAEGGMGVVYLARQRSLSREVIVKLIRPELLHFEGTRRRFAREAGAIAQLEHSGIVKVYASGESDGVPFIAMERLDGEPLSDRIARDNQASRQLHADATWVRTCLDLAAQVADALQHAHARGILHRDVKPSNILVDSAGRATLIDFGLHALEEGEDTNNERFTREGSAPGTLLYMAPEQLESGSFDVRSEVYALGATLYEMLSGTPPFRGSSRSTTEQMIRRGGPKSLQQLQRAVPSDVDAIVRKALSVDPTRRYVDCGALARDLRNALDARPVAARPDSVGYRLRCWARRQPALATMTAIAALLAIAAPAGIILEQQQSARTLRAAYDEERTARLAAEDMAGFVIDLVEAADPNVQKPLPAVRQILKRGVERVDERLADYPTRHAEVQKVLGRIHGSLGLFEQSSALLNQSVETLSSAHAERLASFGPDDRRTREALGHLVESRGARARMRELAGDRSGAFLDRRQLEVELAKLWQENKWRQLYARAEWMRLAPYAPKNAFGDDGPPTSEEVLESIREAAEATAEAATAPDSYKVATQGWLGAQLVGLGQSENDGLKRRALLEEARDTLSAALTAMASSTQAGSLDHADMLNAYGLSLKLLGDLASAERQYGAALQIFEERLGPENLRIGMALVNFAALLKDLGRQDEALSSLERGYEIFHTASGPEDPNTVIIFGNLCGTRFHAGEHEGLAEEFTELIRLQTEVFSPQHQFLAASFERRGVLRAKLGRRDEASADLEEALQRFEEFLSPESSACVRVREALSTLQAASASGEAADER